MVALDKPHLYQVNKSKQEIIQIKNMFPFKWVSSSFSYVGINIPLYLLENFKSNHDKLIEIHDKLIEIQ